MIKIIEEEKSFAKSKHNLSDLGGFSEPVKEAKRKPRSDVQAKNGFNNKKIGLLVD